MQQAQFNQKTMYRYYGVPAAASREGGLPKDYLGARKVSQALAVAAVLTPYDFVSALTASDAEQVDIVKAPNRMEPAQGELKICTVSNVVEKILKAVQQLTCEACKIQFKHPNTLRAHEASKKHKKNFEKLQDSVTPEPAKPPNGAVEVSIAPAAAVADGVIPAVQPKKRKMPATPMCEVCKIQFSGPLQLENHIIGRKHKNKLKKLNESITPNPENPPNGAVGESTVPLTCEVCKNKFATLHGLRDHEASQKHKKNLEKLQYSVTPEPAKPPNGVVGASIAPVAAAVADGVIPAVVLEDGAAQGELNVCTVSNVVEKILKAVHLLTCEACKIQFNPNRLTAHETGKKHKKNLEKLQDSITPEPAKPPNDAVGASTTPSDAVADGVVVVPAVMLEAGAAQGELNVCTVSNVAVGASTTLAAAVADGVVLAVQPKKSKRAAATPEDLEARKRRLIETGVAKGELKICTMCNVLTMNQKNFESHITGAKHKANVRKQQLAQLPHVSTAVGASTAPAAAVVADGVIPAVVLAAESIAPEPAKYPNSVVEASTEPAAAVADGVIPAVMLEAGAAQGELNVCTVSNVAAGASTALAAVADGARDTSCITKEEEEARSNPRRPGGKEEATD